MKEPRSMKVTCPVCGAKPTESCIDLLSDQPVTWRHKERVILAFTKERK
jgi:formate dehydrogenase maturation protein FdhE